MPWQVLAFTLGVCWLQQLAVLPAPTFLAAMALGSAGLWFAARQHRHAPFLSRSLSLCAAALLGLAWAGGFAHWRLADELPAAWEGRDIEITGIVADLPQRLGEPGRGVRFTFDTAAASAPVPQRIALSWYRQVEPVDAADEVDDAGEVAPPGAMPLPRAGERWRFVVRLKRPHGNANPHGFDYAGWLFERGVRATGYVRKSALTARLDGQAGGLSGSVGRLREAVRARIQRTLPDAPYAGILAALAVGDQQAIAPTLWRLFAATGITHLMSISGLHVTMIGGLVAWLVAQLWRRVAWPLPLPLLWPAQKAAALAGFVAAVAYALLAGFGIPAQRTLYMLGVVAVALISGRAVATAHVLGAALLLVLLLDPWAVLAAGFWLSFGAVALLFYIANGRVARSHWLAVWGRAQWAMTLGLIPALLALFQQFSLVSPFANALAIPLVSLLVTPLALLGSLPGFSWALQLAHALLVPLLEFLAWLAALPGALWQQHAPPFWSVLLASLGVVWLLLPRGFPARWLGLLTFLPLFLVVPERPSPGALALTVLDVGQGQAVHVQTATHDLVFDTGPAFNAQADSGSRIVVPYLRAQGVGRLDGLIVSHADQDHAGGALSLMAALPVGWLATSVPDAHPILQTSVPQSALRARHPCIDGENWEWDDVRFRLLHPTRGDYAGQRPTNAMSCVLKIETQHGSILIPGDLEGPAETALLARHGAALRADILVAPHHGGKRTSSPDFVAAVGAREVIFPVGYRNRFGHPYPAVLERYVAAGARLHRTDAHGAVTLKVGAGGTAITHERDLRRRYWHNASLLQSFGSIP